MALTNSKVSKLLIIFLLLRGTTAAEIELISLKEDPSPHVTTVRLGITMPNENVQTEIVLRYPGTAKAIAQDGQEKLMLSNQQSSIVAFNFRAGTQANDSVVVVLSSQGRVVYFFDLNHVVSQLIEKWKNGLDEGAFRVVAIRENRIVLEYFERQHGSTARKFHVSVRVFEDGSLGIEQQDIRD